MPPARRTALALAAALLAGAGATGCAPGTVQVSFRPVAAARTAYRVTVTTDSTLAIEGLPVERERQVTTLRTDQVVLDAGPDGTRVQVSIAAGQEPAQVVIVRLDRSAQLVGIEPVPGSTPAVGLDRLGVAELFPSAATAPPDRPLRPGERWSLDSAVTLPDTAPSRLTGVGRIAALGRAAGRRTATVASTLELPVVRRTESASGRETVLEGRQRSVVASTHDLADGALERVEATTEASYALRLLPPAGVEAKARPGSLRLVVRSVTVRIGRGSA